MDEGDDREHEEGEAEGDPSHPPPAVLDERPDQLGAGGEEHHDPEQDRDPVDGRPVEAEDDDREEDPQRAGDEEEPPAARARRGAPQRPPAGPWVVMPTSATRAASGPLG